MKICTHCHTPKENTEYSSNKNKVCIVCKNLDKERQVQKQPPPQKLTDEELQEIYKAKNKVKVYPAAKPVYEKAILEINPNREREYNSSGDRVYRNLGKRTVAITTIDESTQDFGL